MKLTILLTASALALSACAPGHAPKKRPDICEWLNHKPVFDTRGKCIPNDGDRTHAKPSKPSKPEKPEEPEVDNHEPNIGEPGRWDWEDRNGQPSTRPGAGDNDRTPDRAEGKPDRHDADRAHNEVNQ